MYFQPASSTDSALNIEACTFNLYSFACVQRILYMKMHISRCSDPILLCLYPQIPCTFAFLQQVWGTLAAIFLHGSVAEAPGWSTVLALDSGFGCWIVQVHHPVPPQDIGQGSPPYCQQNLHLPVRESWERPPPKHVT